MKPRTKLQRQVVELSSRLPGITEGQKKWALKHCLFHKATLLKNGTLSCLDCGHRWKSEHQLSDKVLGCTCPKCNTELKVEPTRKRVFHDWAYFGIIITFQGFQIIRLYKVNGNYKAGNKPYLNCYELSQIWLSPNGKFEIVGYNHHCTWYGDTWNGAFTLKSRKVIHSHDIMPYKIYPKRKYIPEIKRNGFKGHFHGLPPYSLFRWLLLKPKAETLLKAKQYDLLRHSEKSQIDIYWNSIKICIRNNYKVDDASIWFDYLELLEYFNKDLRNPKYICPSDLHQAHDKLVSIKSEIEIGQKEIQAAQVEYEANKKPFFGLQFSKGNIQVKVLQSIREFIEEGVTLHHCVFTNGYYKKKNSLILSARIKNKRLATVEVDISKLKVVQVRGKRNNPTEYNPDISDIVNDNLNRIREVIKSTRKEPMQA